LIFIIAIVLILKSTFKTCLKSFRFW
jgi:hypothetical protein